MEQKEFDNYDFVGKYNISPKGPYAVIRPIYMKQDDVYERIKE